MTHNEIEEFRILPTTDEYVERFNRCVGIATRARKLDGAYEDNVPMALLVVS